jgi:death-on-curing protein
MGQGDGQEVEWLERLVGVVREVHDLMLAVGGGMPGEHTASLYAACARPFQTAFGESIYSDVFGRAAAILHAIVCDHVFADCNKRTGTVTACFFLDSEGILPPRDNQESLRLNMLGDVALAAASGYLTVDQVGSWIRRIFEPESRTAGGAP